MTTRRIWYVDGVSCLGKTTFVAGTAANGLKLDYAERSSAVPFFREKADSHVVQILYTATFGLEVLQHVTSDAATSMPLFVDRSPISDVWYELLFKHYDDLAYQQLVFDRINELRVFDRMPTVFVIPDPSHANAICEQMRLRSNGLDRICASYVLQQIQIFERVVQRFGEHPNVRVIRVALDMPIFTPTYFNWITEKFGALASTTTDYC